MRIPCLILAAALGAALPAQTLASPKGFESTEGGGFAHIFGRYADGRFQFAEGDLRGKTLSITSVAYRLDHRNHTTDTAMGRKWTTVILHAGECNYNTFSQQWNRNALTTPTQVFRAAVHWQSQTGTPLLKPATWGGLKKDLLFAFSSPFKFSGKNDLLLNYDFAGGVLDNSASWTFTDPRFYYLDGESISTSPRSGTTTSFPISNPCADSSLSQFPGAAASIAAITYADNDPDIRYRGKLRVYHETTYTAPNALVLQALGPSGLSFGLAVGARCNSLYVNTNQPWIPFYRVADQNGASGRKEYVIPWLSLYGSLQLWTQGAWTDSKSKVLSLTRAAMVVIPGGKPPSVVPRKKVVFHYVKNLGVGSGPVTAHDHNPFLLIRYR